MSRLLNLLSLLLLSLSCAGCGYVAVSGAIQPGTQTVSGMVSIVQFSFVNGVSSVTIVTLVGQNMTGMDTADTLRFCGDQRSQFPMDTTVNARFSPGTSCNNLVSVTFP
jgi:hypothetical protein